MIRQSYPWKKELRRLRRVLATIGDEALEADLADYKIEKPLLQSAIIVRRLIESWKVTDATRARQFEIKTFPCLPDRHHVLPRLTMQGDIEREFDLDAGSGARMDAWNITSELIHSGFINWEIDERDRFTAIYLASIRNQARRLLRIPLATYLSVLEAIDADHVEQITTSIDEDGKLLIAIV